MPPRLARLSGPLLHYGLADLAAMEVVVARDRFGVAAVGAWEVASEADRPGRRPALALHGLYVDRDRQGLGLGTALVGTARTAALARGYRALVVRAHESAADFFAALGFRPFPDAGDADRNAYPHRFWVEP